MSLWKTMTMSSVTLLVFVGMPLAQKKKVRSNVPGLETQGLIERFQNISCAIGRVLTDEGSGTGFFIDRDGDFVTAAHVVANASYSGAPGQESVELKSRGHIHIIPHRGKVLDVELTLSPEDQRMASSDLVIINTDEPRTCYLPVGNSDALKVGQHLISAGFPASSRELSLYEGFLSSRYRSRVPIGHIGLRPVYPQYEVLRLQMPVTPGASGSPVINDKNEVVGIVTEVPVVWTQDLVSLTEKIERNPNAGDGAVIGGGLGAYDVVKLIGDLAVVVREFESPGSALAVPSSYLNLPVAQQSQTH